MKKTVFVVLACAVAALALLINSPAVGSTDLKLGVGYWFNCVCIALAAIFSVKRVAALDGQQYGERLVGLLTAAVPPNPRTRPFVKCVLPAPKPPTSASTSPAPSPAANRCQAQALPRSASRWVSAPSITCSRAMR